MKNENEIKFAWKIFHLLSLLNDSIWEYYEDEFMNMHRQHTDVLYRGSLNDHMGHDDPEF